mgnify:FL=1
MYAFLTITNFLFERQTRGTSSGCKVMQLIEVQQNHRPGKPAPTEHVLRKVILPGPFRGDSGFPKSVCGQHTDPLNKGAGG